MDDKTLKTQIEMFTGGTGEGKITYTSALTLTSGQFTLRGEFLWRNNLAF
jgi:hypothetical protein